MVKVEDFYAAFEDGSTEMPFKLPKEITEISYYYDGGRTAISINGITVFENLGLGSDFCVTINNE